MPRERKQIDKRKIISVAIPVVIAVIVVVALAISGHITKNKDIEKPTSIVTETTSATEEAKKENAKVTLVAVGDNLIHNTLISAGEKEDGTRDYSSFYKDIKPYISSADIAILNQETILGGPIAEYTGYPVFNSPQEIGDAAISAGFDIFTCATNHSMDVGSAGIEKECEFFSKYPNVTQIGVYDNKDDYNTIAYTEKNGIKFAWLNYTYGTNGISIPDDKPYLVSMLDEERVEADIKQARKNADVVVVLPHWGTENSHEINDSQRKYVKMFSDLGVDIVIGTHPHVVQPVEWVTNEETGKKMIVFYSLGNFISHQINLNQMLGGMAEITVERKGGEIQVTSAKMAPIIDYYTRSDTGFSFSTYKFSDYNDELANTQAQDGATVEYFQNLFSDVVSEEFCDFK